ncbi:MAG: M24 family metallopeptidase [Erysipelotrichaceae bacterium]|nr:M24 family metallopeptidase [Erysipelotrichaceae bacterium]
MVLYTSNDNDLIFNKARQKAVMALQETIDEFYGKKGITEKAFAQRWLDKMSEKGEIFGKGWYCPPPYGMAVLSGKRLNFDSLRNEEFWSNDTLIDWEDGLLYAYCSPVEKSDGYIGDMSITLYFGKDEKIREHFRNCRKAAQDIFEYLNVAEDPDELYAYSLKAFKNRGLRSNVISRTDPKPSNLGHTFTHLNEGREKEELNQEMINHLSSSRKFLNGSSGLSFEEGMQFTVEPQLISLTDESLPKVTHHFVVKKKDDDFIVCNDIDSLLNRFDLI